MRDTERKNNLTVTRREVGRDNEKGFQELLLRTHGQKQGTEWKQGREGELAGVGGSDGGKMQTILIEQQGK